MRAAILVGVASVLAEGADVFPLRFVSSGMCLAPFKGSEDKLGIGVRQYPCSTEPNQGWKKIPAASGNGFLLRNNQSRMCLEELGGDEVTLQKCRPEAEHQVFTETPRRGMKLKSSGTCLVIKGHMRSSGAELMLTPCSGGLFQAMDTEVPPTGSEVVPRMHFTFTKNLCLAPWKHAENAEGIGIKQYPCSAVLLGQQWEKLPAPSEAGGFLLRNRQSKKCLDGSKAEIEQRKCNFKDDDQVFSVMGGFAMRVKGTGKCLEIKGGARAALYQEECKDDSPRQRIDTDPAPPPAPPGPPRPQPIRFAFSKKCLDGAGDTKITQVECTGAELWDKVLVYGGGFLLNNTKSGNCAAALGRSGWVAERPCNGKDASQIFEDAPGGGLKTKLSRKCLAVEGGSKAAGKRLRQQRCDGGAKQRILQEAAEVSLRMFSSGLCLELLDYRLRSGALLGGRRCTGHANQRWDRLDTLNGGFRLRNVYSGMCMAVKRSSSQDGAPIVQLPCGRAYEAEAFNQVFKRRYYGGALVARHSKKCVQLEEQTGEARQYTCGDNNGLKQRVMASSHALSTPREEKYPSPPQPLDGEPPVSDYTLVPPSGSTPYLPLAGPGVGHTERRARLSDEAPLYHPYNGGLRYLDNLFSEVVQGRVRAVMVGSRGTGEGNMNPSNLGPYIEALEKNGLTPELMKIALFLDTANWSIRARALFGGRGIDLASHEQFARIVWHENVLPHFNTVPRERWFRIRNRPVIQTWGLNPAMKAHNHFAHLSERYSWLANHFEKTFKERPVFVMAGANLKTAWGDATFFDNPDLLGLNGWFSNAGWTAPQFHGTRLGTAIAGYHDNNHRSGVPRRDGRTFFNSLLHTQNTSFTIIESWTNLIEKMAVYRSEAHGWPTPNVYINHLQRFNDPEALTLRLECEAADRFVDSTPGNEGGDGPPRFKEGVFRYSGDLDIFEFEGEPGWAVGWTTPGESITHVDVYFGDGYYRFTLKYASTHAQVVELEVGGVRQGKVSLPATGGWKKWRKIHLATGVEMTEGPSNVALTFVTGNVNADWVFVKKEGREKK